MTPEKPVRGTFDEAWDAILEAETENCAVFPNVSFGADPGQGWWDAQRKDREDREERKLAAIGWTRDEFEAAQREAIRMMST